VIAQRNQPESHRAAALPLRITIPMEVIIMQDRAIEQWALLSRHYDDRCGLDQHTGGERLARKDAAAFYRIAANFKAIFRARRQTVESLRSPRR
jgi:hypothetical protein